MKGEVKPGVQTSLRAELLTHPDDVLGPSRPGTCLIHVGDVGRVKGLEAIVRGADMLAIEATYLRREADMARHFAHLTAAQAAQLARDADVRRLVLTHISRRYRDAEILEEARAIFPETVVARDFDHFRVLRGGAESET